MRYVVLGAGAVGGTIGVLLAEAGCEVTLIARGDHGRAIETTGLTLRTPDGSRTRQFDVVDCAGKLAWRADDIVILAVKSQDTVGALADVPTNTAVVCAQNGVTNEPTVAERFEHVYGMMVWTPAVHLEPGVVAAYATPPGVLRIGCHRGSGELSDNMVRDLTSAGFDAAAVPDIMRLKYGKLLGNLGNILDAYCIRDGTLRPVYNRAMAEGAACLRAAGIDYAPEDELHRDMQSRMSHGEIDGQTRPGGSTWQSATRNSSTELSYLNGYICDLGRRVGVATPINDALMTIAKSAPAPRSVRTADYPALC